MNNKVPQNVSMAYCFFYFSTDEIHSYVMSEVKAIFLLRCWIKLLCYVQPSNMDQLLPGLAFCSDNFLCPVPHGWRGSPLSSCFALIASPLTASDPPRRTPNCLWIDDEPGNRRRQSDENSACRRERFRSCAADRIAVTRERLCDCRHCRQWTQQLWN